MRDKEKTEREKGLKDERLIFRRRRGREENVTGDE